MYFIFSFSHWANIHHSALYPLMKNGELLCGCWLHSNYFCGKWGLKPIVKKHDAHQHTARLYLPSRSLLGLVSRTLKITHAHIFLRQLSGQWLPFFFLAFTSVQEKKNFSEIYNPITLNKGNTPKDKSQEWARGWEEGSRSLLFKAYVTVTPFCMKIRALLLTQFLGFTLLIIIRHDLVLFIGNESKVLKQLAAGFKPTSISSAIP